MNLENHFLPYELSIKIKNLCFNKPCLAVYKGNVLHYNGVGDRCFDEHFSCKGKNKWTPAPIWQQAFDFIEDQYGLLGNVDNDGINYFIIISNKNILFDNDTDRCVIGGYADRNEARVALLEELLKRIV